MTEPPTMGAILEHQQVLVGMLGMALTAGALFALRAVPKSLWAALRETASVSLTIDSDDSAYHHVSVWLARHKRATKSRRLMLTQAYNYDAAEWRWEMTLGPGWHWVTFDGGLILVHRQIQDPDALAKAIGGGRRERLKLISLGRSQLRIRNLVAGAREDYHGVGMVQIYFWTCGCYTLADKRKARALDTIFLPVEQKQRLVGDIEAFVQAREAYNCRGIPWRRGYLFEGPPGTGKTTLIGALAGHVGRSLYVLNLNNLAGDNELITAINAVGSDGVVVIEDIDGVRVSHDREAASSAAPSRGNFPTPLISQDARGITLSGLLNAIDGVTARDGRILFITSNKPDQLDAALLRPGRVDMREHIGLLGEPEAKEMYRAFRPDAPAAEFERTIFPALPMSAATLQNLLLSKSAVATHTVTLGEAA